MVRFLRWKYLNSKGFKRGTVVPKLPINIKKSKAFEGETDRRTDWHSDFGAACMQLKKFVSPSKFYYLHNRNLYTLKISSFIDVKIDTNQSQNHQHLVWAPFDWITATIGLGSVLNHFLRYFGVMAFQTILAILLTPFLDYI